MWVITEKDTGYVIAEISNRDDVDKYLSPTTLYYYTPDFTGDVGLSHKYDPLTKTFKMKLFQEVRLTRNKLLTESDYRLTSDYSGDDVEAWKTYRQALKDIPQNYTGVDDVVWPTKP